MENKTTNKEVINNSNQSPINLKLNGMIQKKISDLTNQISDISNEISGLRKIDVVDETTKISMGSTKVNIEDFMSEPDIKTYRNWLELKEILEKEYKNDDEVDNMLNEFKEEKWSSCWYEYVYNNCSEGDLIQDVWDYIDWGEFISEHFNRDSSEIQDLKSDWIENECGKKELVNDLIEMNLRSMSNG